MLRAVRCVRVAVGVCGGACVWLRRAVYGVRCAEHSRAVRISLSFAMPGRQSHRLRALLPCVSLPCARMGGGGGVQSHRLRALLPCVSLLCARVGQGWVKGGSRVGQGWVKGVLDLCGVEVV